jgi:Ca-activated chloride channel family protein
LLKQKRPAEAAVHFEDRQWQGVALYEAGDYGEAAQRFAEGSGARAHYNRGNALARSGELEAALDAYEQALELQPDLRPAQANIALVQSLLKEQASTPDKPPEPAESEEPAPGPAEQSPDAGASTQSSEPGQPSSESTATPDDPQAPRTPPPPGAQDVPGSELPDEQTTTPPLRPAPGQRNEEEQRQALEQWLRQIPDNPGELLRRKFWYEQQSHQAQGKTP